jgi:hypothetical protein
MPIRIDVHNQVPGREVSEEEDEAWQAWAATAPKCRQCQCPYQVATAEGVGVSRPDMFCCRSCERGEGLPPEASPPRRGYRAGYQAGYQAGYRAARRGPSSLD